MSGYKKFAVAGAGNFGKFIVKELLQLKNEGTTSSVSVLTRSVRPTSTCDAVHNMTTELSRLAMRTLPSSPSWA